MKLCMDSQNNKSSMNFSELTFAYLKPVVTKQGKGFAVCTASGEQLAVFDTRDAAFFAAKREKKS